MPLPLIAMLRTRLHAGALVLRRWYLRGIWRMDIGSGCEISFSAKLDKTNPNGVHIGEYTIVTFGAVILSHDAVYNRHLDTRIGKFCFIGARSIILPGVEIGDYSIVGAGSVVVQSVPAASLVAGNPARVVRSDLTHGYYGMEIPSEKGGVQPTGEPL